MPGLPLVEPRRRRARARRRARCAASGALARRRRRARRHVEAPVARRGALRRAASGRAVAARGRARRAQVGKDPRAVELILRESTAVSRQAPGVLVVRHRLGFVVANAGIDASNAVPADARAGQRSVGAAPARGSRRVGAAAIRARVEAASGARVGVVITDSFGRPFRRGHRGRRHRRLGAAAPVGPARRAGPLRAHRSRTRSRRWPTRSPLWPISSPARPPSVARSCSCAGSAFAPSDQGAGALVRRAEEDLYA